MKIEDQWFEIDEDANIIHARDLENYKPENRLRHARMRGRAEDKTACGLDFDPTAIVITEDDTRQRCHTCQAHNDAILSEEKTA